MGEEIENHLIRIPSFPAKIAFAERQRDFSLHPFDPEKKRIKKALEMIEKAKEWALTPEEENRIEELNHHFLPYQRLEQRYASIVDKANPKALEDVQQLAQFLETAPKDAFFSSATNATLNALVSAPHMNKKAFAQAFIQSKDQDKILFDFAKATKDSSLLHAVGDLYAEEKLTRSLLSWADETVHWHLEGFYHTIHNRNHPKRDEEIQTMAQLAEKYWAHASTIEPIIYQLIQEEPSLEEKQRFLHQFGQTGPQCSRLSSILNDRHEQELLISLGEHCVEKAKTENDIPQKQYILGIGTLCCQYAKNGLDSNTDKGKNLLEKIVNLEQKIHENPQTIK